MRYAVGGFALVIGCNFHSGAAPGSGDAPTGDGTTDGTIDSITRGGSDAIIVPAGWWNTQWTQRSEIEVVNTTITGDLASFPVLVTLTAANFGYSASTSTGSDLRFIAADNTTSLAYDIDTFAPNGTSQVWVSVPAIAATPAAHTMFWMYYGNASAITTAAPQTVWHDDVAVYHLSDPTDDATQNGHTGSAPGGNTLPTTANGIVGSAQSFNGSSQAIQLANQNDFNLGSFTVGVWIKSPAFTADYQCFVCKGDHVWRLQRADTNAFAEFGTTDSGNNNVDGTSTVDDNNWHFIAGTYDAGDNFKKILYVDGAQQGTSNALAMATSTDAVEIGNNEDVTAAPFRYFGGLIDELRVTAQVRSANWINTEYVMMTSNAIVVVHAAQPL